ASASDLVRVRKAGLPRDARVLLHETHLRLGIGVPSVSDARGTQGALSYRRMRSPRELWEKLRALGVTHVVWSPSPGGQELYGDEIVFYDFVTHHLRGAKLVEGMWVAELGATPPSDVPYGPVALQGCGLAHRASLPEVDTKIWEGTPAPSQEQKLQNQQ